MKNFVKISLLIGLIFLLANCAGEIQKPPAIAEDVQQQEIEDLQKPRLVFQSRHSGIVSSVAFSPNGKIVASGSWDSTIKLWDADTGKELHTLSGHLDCIKTVAFSPTGQLIASGGLDKAIKLWDIYTGRDLFTFKGHSEVVSAVTFSPDNQLIASASADKTIRLWDIRTGKEIRKIKGHSKSIAFIAFSPDGQLIASGGWDDTIKFWDVRTGRKLRTLEGHSGWVTSAEFSPDGQFIVSGSGDGAIILWEVRSGKQLQVFPGHAEGVMSVSFSSNGRIIASGGRDKTIKLWDIQNGKELQTLKGHSGEITSVAFSPDGTIIASGSWDQTLKFWNVNTGKEIQTLSGDTNRKVPVALSFDGHVSARVSRDEIFTFWDSQTNKEYYSDTGKAVSSDKRLSAYTLTGTNRNGRQKWSTSIQVWDISDTSEPICKLEKHSEAVRALAFSFSGEILASGGSDKTIILWDVRSNRQSIWKRNIATLKGHSGTIFALAFSPNDRLLASGSDDATVKIWDVQTGKELRTFTGHSGKVKSVAFNSDGTILASEDQDKILKLWDVKHGQELATVFAVDDHDWAVITPNGQFDATPGAMDLMHWVVGLEPIELAQLKNRYYEPHLLPKLLGLSDEPLRDVPAFTKAELYPEVKFAEPEPADPTLHLNLTNQGGGIGKVAVFLNGKEVTADARADTANPQVQELEVTLDLSEHPFLMPEIPNVVEVKAYNAEGYLVSRGLTMSYEAPKPEVAPEKPVEPPHVWAIVVGVSDYQGDTLDLQFAAKDAEDMAHALQLSAKRLFGVEHVHLTVLTSPALDPQASRLPTRQNLIQALETVREAKSTDILVIYLAGHGVNYGGQEGDYYYLTADAHTGNLNDPVVRQHTAISSQELTDLILKIPALKQVLILDTCESGRFVDKLTEKRAIPSSQIRALERMKDRSGLHILAGAAADAVSYEASRYGQGLLTYSLLLGMRGAALREEEYVDISKLFEFAADHVPELAQDIGGIQRPVVATPRGGSSFDIGRLTSADKPQIPLAKVRPLVLRASFQDEAHIRDHVGLTKRINDKLRELSARGQNAPIVFVDTVEFPEAYALAGRYQVEGDHITVNVYLFHGEEEIGQFTVAGALSDLDRFTEEIAQELRITLESVN